MNIEVIAFDADDTLWANENHYRDAEDAFCALVRDYMPAAAVSEELFKTEKANSRLPIANSQ